MTEEKWFAEKKITFYKNEFSNHSIKWLQVSGKIIDMIKWFTTLCTWMIQPLSFCTPVEPPGAVQDSQL